jgi:hypothetical protein
MRETLKTWFARKKNADSAFEAKLILAGIFTALACIAFSSASPNSSIGQSYGFLATIAGKGGNCRSDVNGWLTDFEGGPAVRADLSSPHMAMADSAGNIYIADKDAHAVRKVDPKGILTTVAGTSVAGDDGDGPAREHQLYSPNGLWVNNRGAFYILDLGNGKIRKVDTAGNMTTVVRDTNGISGGRGLWVSRAEDTIWYSSGTVIRMWTKSGGITAFAAGFGSLGNFVQAPGGNIVATDRSANMVYWLDNNGAKTVIAGNGTATGGGDGFPALETAFYGVRGVWFLEDNTYFLATHEGSQVWYIDQKNIAHLFLDGLAGDANHSGDGENFNTPGLKVSEVRSVTVDYQGNVIIAENDCGFIRKVEKRKSDVLFDGMARSVVAPRVFQSQSTGSIVVQVPLPIEGRMNIRIVDQRGRVMDAAMIGPSAARGQGIQWQSRKLSGGAYSIAIQAKTISLTKKCVLIR